MKSILSSKTVWLNLIATAIAALAMIPSLISGLHMSPHAASVIIQTDVFVTGVLNLILRVFFTSQPLTVTALDQVKKVN